MYKIQKIVKFQKKKCNKIKIRKEKNSNGYAATAKESTTVLNYCNSGPDLIDCIYNASENKNK